MIKLIPDLEIWEIMKRASEGEQWATLYNVDGIWKVPDNQSTKNLCNCIVGFYGVGIIEKPEVIEGWVNCFSGGIYATIYETKKRALENGVSDCTACIPIKFTVGEGLDNE
jgi:hypothetical protein